jgi:hypothetical protein
MEDEGNVDLAVPHSQSLSDNVRTSHFVRHHQGRYKGSVLVPESLEDQVSTLSHGTKHQIHVPRLNLNYKRIPYKTVWVEYADIQHLLKDSGASPTDKRPDGTDRYTLPAIQDPATGQVITESFAIAQYLEKKYPDRPVIPAGTDAQQSSFVQSILVLLGPVRDISLPVESSSDHRLGNSHGSIQLLGWTKRPQQTRIRAPYA